MAHVVAAGSRCLPSYALWQSVIQQVFQGARAHSSFLLSSAHAAGARARCSGRNPAWDGCVPAQQRQHSHGVQAALERQSELVGQSNFESGVVDGPDEPGTCGERQLGRMHAASWHVTSTTRQNAEPIGSQ